MNYTSYQKSRNLSWKIIINEGINSLPVKVGDLCQGLNIKIFSSEGEIDESGDGQSLIRDGQALIMVNVNTSLERQRFTIAHELGHILLGHVGKRRLINREPSPNDNPIEQEANLFASRLLAPACVLWALDIHSAEEIAELCRISKTAAKFRAERMEALYAREKQFLKERGKSCFLISPLEKQVFEQFKEFIGERRA